MDEIEQPPNTIFSLHAITRRLKELLLEVECKRFCVQAQFVPENGGKLSGGHCYASLVETDETGKTIARMRAVIWRSHRERIEQKLRQAGCEQSLTEEQEICALSAIRFHPVYGLSLEISDVDPTMGVSLLERNRHEVLERLKAANLLDLNKSLPLPAACLRIGLITASGSAAYADFTKTLLMSGYAFQIFLVPATMQGETTPAQVIRAIRLLECQDVDVICLVRGGGSPLDLASFDLEAIGQAIARVENRSGSALGMRSISPCPTSWPTRVTRHRRRSPRPLSGGSRNSTPGFKRPRTAWKTVASAR